MMHRLGARYKKDDCQANCSENEPVFTTKEVTSDKQKVLERMFGGYFKDKSDMHFLEIVTDPKEKEEIKKQREAERNSKPIKIEVKKEKKKNSKLNDKAVERTLNNVLQHVDIILPFISSVLFTEIDKFEELVCEYYNNAISIEDYKLLSLIIREDLEKLKRKFQGIFEFKNFIGKECLRKIRKPGMPPSECCTSEEEDDDDDDGEDLAMECIKSFFEFQREEREKDKQEKLKTSAKVAEKCLKCEELMKELDDRCRKMQEVNILVNEFARSLEDKHIALDKNSKELDVLKKTLQEEKNRHKLELNNKEKRIQQLDQQRKTEAGDFASWKTKQLKKNDGLKEQLKRDAADHETWKKKQLKRMDDVEQQLKSANENIRDLEHELEQSRLSEYKSVKEKNGMMDEIQKLTTRSGDLKKSCETLQTINRGKSEHIEKLENRLAHLEHLYMLQASFPQAPMMLTPPPMAYHTPKRCPIVQKKMEEYEQILRIDVQGMMRMIYGTVERFAERCHDSQELLSAKLEISNFVKRFELFIGIVDKQLQFCQQNIGVRIEELAKIPDFPAPFSDLFMKNYEQSLKKSKERKCWKKVENGNAKELEDDECLICMGEMDHIENITKCTKCNRKYHSECVSEWLKRMSTCPVCRASFPDPLQFPEL